MKPIKFPGHNTVYAENQPPYQPLPTLVDVQSPYGPVISCWQLTFRERLKILFTGVVWMQLLMFKNDKGHINPLTPSKLTVNRKEVIG